ncbi:MAG TPA: hypothetical protein VF530_00975 [Planctomycetota bacterium]
MNQDLPAPARPGGILGKLLVLLLFLALAGSVVRGFLVTPVDGTLEQRELFGDGGPPAGLTLASAVRLPTGDAVVRFERTGEGGGARDVVFLEYASRPAAEAAMRATAGDGPQSPAERLKEWEKDKAFDWVALMKRGEIEWGEWRAKLVIERSFRKGGGWSEEARVDLSTQARPLVLCVRWPEETPADEVELRGLLAAVRLAPGS